jgi:pimeloyl-ACP methyl ester carboxylesterase
MPGEVEEVRRDPSVLNGLGLSEIVDHYAGFVRGLDRPPVLGNPANRKRTVELTPRQFHYNFTNTMTQDESKVVYDRYQVPGPGRLIFDAAVANFNPRAGNKVDFHKDDRPPLLIIGNELDHTVPASVSKEAAKRLGKSEAVVDYKEFAGRPHFAGAPGWEAVADYALDWAERHTGATAPA